MKFVILSRTKIDSVENGTTEFVAEDLLEAIESSKSLIITSDEVLGDVRKDHPYHKFEYTITIERK